MQISFWLFLKECFNSRVELFEAVHHIGWTWTGVPSLHSLRVSADHSNHLYFTAAHVKQDNHHFALAKLICLMAAIAIFVKFLSHKDETYCRTTNQIKDHNERNQGVGLIKCGSHTFDVITYIFFSSVANSLRLQSTKVIHINISIFCRDCQGKLRISSNRQVNNGWRKYFAGADNKLNIRVAACKRKMMYKTKYEMTQKSLTSSIYKAHFMLFWEATNDNKKHSVKWFHLNFCITIM